MRSTIVEFPYFHKVVGPVIVEAEVMLYKGIPNAESDWDAEDYLDILSVAVYDEGKLINVDIPRKAIYSEISAQIRDAEMSQMFLEESGGF